MNSGRSSGNANERDRKWLRKVRAATLPQLRVMYKNATEHWKEIAIERAIRRLLDSEEKS